MTKQLSSAFFGDKKLTEVFLDQVRKFTSSLRQRESFRVAILKSSSSPTLPNSQVSLIKITMYHYSNFLISLCRELFRSLLIGSFKNLVPLWKLQHMFSSILSRSG